NIEAGNFSKGPRGEIDIKFDSTTIDPGMYVYEKMLSGAYLGGLATEVIRYAINDGLFTKAFSSR
ncbi:unnamed protein product, partial [marine sediment metagenome]